MRVESMSGLSERDQNLIERFVATYNAVDQELRRRTHSDEYAGFSKVVQLYAESQPRWPYSQRLRHFGDLRNFIAHSSTKPYERLAIPTAQVVKEIEEILASFSERVIPQFQREVVMVEPENTLDQVFALVKQHNYSQFPVRTQTGEIELLLTENGITRWLARHTQNEMSLVDFSEVMVRDVVTEEETKKNLIFVSRKTLADDAFARFVHISRLEAVVITENGKPTEKPLGIITRWDLPE